MPTDRIEAISMAIIIGKGKGIQQHENAPSQKNKRKKSEREK